MVDVAPKTDLKRDPEASSPIKAIPQIDKETITKLPSLKEIDANQNGSISDIELDALDIWSLTKAITTLCSQNPTNPLSSVELGQRRDTAFKILASKDKQTLLGSLGLMATAQKEESCAAIYSRLIARDPKEAAEIISKVDDRVAASKVTIPKGAHTFLIAAYITQAEADAIKPHLPPDKQKALRIALDPDL